MVYTWMKAAVGVLVTANFALPLFTVASNRQLWEEPMAVLALNMSLICMLFGVNLALIALYDIVQLKLPALCNSLQYTGFGFGVAFKMAQVCMAVDQFVAIAHPLQHYSLMSRARRWLFAVTWLTCAAQPVFNIGTVLLGHDTHAESLHRRGNETSKLFPGCRYETSMSRAYIVLAELQMMFFSLVTVALFVYTFVTGYITSASINREMSELQQRSVITQKDLKFLNNNKTFKKIVLVLSMTVTLDIVSPVVRFYSRWYPMPKLNGILHQLRILAFIFEGWAYGLLNTKLRAAYKKTFCIRTAPTQVLPVPDSSHIHQLQQEQQEQPK